MSLDSFSNSITITGPAAEVKGAARAGDIYRRLGEEGADVPADSSLIRDTVRWVEAGDAAPHPARVWRPGKRKSSPNTGADGLSETFRGNEVVFGLGPAGKTYLAVAGRSSR